MKHRGEIVEAAVRKSGVSITKVAEKLGVSRNTLYTKFEEVALDLDFVAKVGEVIHYNFAQDIAELQSDVKPKKYAYPSDNEDRHYNQATEPDSVFGLESPLEVCLKEKLKWQNAAIRYYEILINVAKEHNLNIPLDKL